MTRPLAMRHMRSNMENIWLLGWWSDVMIVLPFLAIFFSSFTSARDLLESSPEVGSSSRRILGSFTSCSPIDTRRRSPPERPRINSLPPMKKSARWVSSSSSMILSTVVFTSASVVTLGSLSLAANMRHSRMVDVGRRLSNCDTMAMLAGNHSRVHGAPSTKRIPMVWALIRMPPMKFSRVVFPDPDGPMRACTSPRNARIETSWRMSKSGVLTSRCWTTT
mmetsp:Transcript_23085/g.36273  ORF Transcript_23085/g.36273 Transcript_23085/m.36273 type:complete len:221 (+) Transcript_23085:3822-4484(+)